MVDVSEKAVTDREAKASARLRAMPETIALIKDGNAPKGDVLATARLAGIMAAKKTPELIPLCHPLLLSKVTVEFAVEHTHIDVTAIVKISGQTGVEMEALTAVSVAALTLYDMLKAADKSMVIERVQLEEKTGGKSGTYQRSEVSSD